jgi:hypothetical protein
LSPVLPDIWISLFTQSLTSIRPGTRHAYWYVDLENRYYIPRDLTHADHSLARRFVSCWDGLGLGIREGDLNDARKDTRSYNMG